MAAEAPYLDAGSSTSLRRNISHHALQGEHPNSGQILKTRASNTNLDTLSDEFSVLQLVPQPTQHPSEDISITHSSNPQSVSQSSISHPQHLHHPLLLLSTHTEMMVCNAYIENNISHLKEVSAENITAYTHVFYYAARFDHVEMCVHCLQSDFFSDKMFAFAFKTAAYYRKINVCQLLLSIAPSFDPIRAGAIYAITNHYTEIVTQLALSPIDHLCYFHLMDITYDFFDSLDVRYGNLSLDHLRDSARILLDEFIVRRPSNQQGAERLIIPNPEHIAIAFLLSTRANLHEQLTQLLKHFRLPKENTFPFLIAVKNQYTHCLEKLMTGQTLGVLLSGLEYATCNKLDLIYDTLFTEISSKLVKRPRSLPDDYTQTVFLPSVFSSLYNSYYAHAFDIVHKCIALGIAGYNEFMRLSQIQSFFKRLSESKQLDDLLIFWTTNGEYDLLERVLKKGHMPSKKGLYNIVGTLIGQRKNGLDILSKLTPILRFEDLLNVPTNDKSAEYTSQTTDAESRTQFQLVSTLPCCELNTILHNPKICPSKAALLAFVHKLEQDYAQNKSDKLIENDVLRTQIELVMRMTETAHHIGSIPLRSDKA